MVGNQALSLSLEPNDGSGRLTLVLELNVVASLADDSVVGGHMTHVNNVASILYMDCYGGCPGT